MGSHSDRHSSLVDARSLDNVRRETAAHSISIVNVVAVGRQDQAGAQIESVCPIMQQWHVIFTKPRCELLVQEQLENRALDSYLPLLKFERGYYRGLRYEPFFPHYLFVKVDLAASEANGLRWLTGVRNVVHFGGNPAVVPAEAIDMLKARLDRITNRVMRKEEWLFAPGQPVRIKTGPFQGFNAIFEKSLSGADRVQILLDFLGQSVRTDVDMHELERVH